MDRRWLAVCTTITLSLLALTNSSAALSSGKSTLQKRSAANTSRAETSGRSSDSRAVAARIAPGCPSCAAQVARNRKRGQPRRGTKTAKVLPCHPKDYVDPKITRHYRAALRDMKRAGIKPQVTSVWRSSEDQAHLHRCSLSTRCRRANPGIYRALPPGKSMHEAGFAVDIAGVAAGPRGEKHLTPKGRRIVAIMERNGFDWRYGLADPAHFEADPRNYGYRNAQQAITRTQTTCQVRLAKNKAHKKLATRVAANHTHRRAQASGEAAATRPHRRTAKARA